MTDTSDDERRFSIAGRVRLSASPLGGRVVELEHGGARAVVSLLGGQVLSYVPAKGAADVLWLSPQARIAPGKSIRGGIPLCWPWFGPHASDPSQPAHGVVRTAPWQVGDSGAGTDGATVRLFWSGGDAAQGAVATGLGVAVVVTLGGRLTVDLVTTNGGATAVTISQALHSYLAVGDVTRIAIEGLDGRDYIDKVDGGRIKRQHGPLVIDGEVDRVFQATGDRVTVADPVLGRRIAIGKSGSTSTVVWNPWVAKAARLGDLGPAGHLPFVCVETANAGSDTRSLAPGATHVLRTEIASEPL